MEFAKNERNQKRFKTKFEILEKQEVNDTLKINKNLMYIAK